VTAIVPDSKRLRGDLGALPPTVKGEVRAKRHPALIPRMLILRSSSAAGERAVVGLVERFGECWWERGRWRVRRVQLRLPGL